MKKKKTGLYIFLLVLDIALIALFYYDKKTGIIKETLLKINELLQPKPAPTPDPDKDPVYYVITFEVDGEQYQREAVRENYSLTKRVTDPSKEGYTFDGWYLGDKKITLSSYKVTGNVTLVAKFTENGTTPIDPPGPVDPPGPGPDVPPEPTVEYPITLVFDGNGGLTANDEEKVTIVIENAEQEWTVPTFDYVEFEFNGWSESITDIKESKTIVALWTYNPYYYTKSSISGFRSVNGVYVVDVPNETTTIEILSHVNYREQYATVYLATDANGVNKIDELYLEQGDNTIYCIVDAKENGMKSYEFKIHRGVVHHVHFNITGPLDLGNTDYDILDGGSVAFVLDKIETGYSYDCDYNLNTPVTSDLTINITYYPTTYNIIFKNVEGANFTNDDTFTMFTSVELTNNVHKTGYQFVGWYTNNTFTEESLITEIPLGTSGDVTVYARFGKLLYNVSFDFDGGDYELEEALPSVYDIDSIISLGKPTKLGYLFDHYDVYYSDNDYDSITGLEVKGTNYLCDIIIIARYKETLENRDTFGYYPRSLVTNQQVINALSGLSKGSNGYIEFDGEYYASYKAKPFTTGITFTNGQEVISNNTYYFLVEPLKYYIVDNGDNTYTLLSKEIIDVNKFNSSTTEKTNTTVVDEEEITTTIYPNNYENSSIRSYLNNTLVKNIFTSEDKFNVATTLVDNSISTVDSTVIDNEEEYIYLSNDTEDTIYLPSISQLNETNTIALVTDYAIAKGATFDIDNYSGFYLTRTPSDNGKFVMGYYSNSNTFKKMYVTSNFGIRVCFKVLSGEQPEIINDNTNTEEETQPNTGENN